MGVERPVLAKSSGEEGKPLHRRRSRRISRGRLLLRRSRCLARVGHQTYIHTAILSATFPSLIALDRLIFTQPNQIHLVGRNAVLRSQVLNHGVGTTLTEVVVVILAADGIPFGGGAGSLRDLFTPAAV